MYKMYIYLKCKKCKNESPNIKIPPLEIVSSLASAEQLGLAKNEELWYNICIAA